MTDAYPLSGNEKEADARQVVERSRETAERGGRVADQRAGGPDHVATGQHPVDLGE